MATEPSGEPLARRPGQRTARRAGSPEDDLPRELHEKRRRPDDVTGRLPERPIAEASEQPVNRYLVAAALDRLTQEHRDVLRECCFRGSSVAQAADALEIAPDMVKSRAYYALCALRLAIEELGGVQ
jgi:RNA polymerase sigma-70 factor, ECF subfamily